VSTLLEDFYLNVAMRMPKSRSNGPGIRAVIWVQGCTIGCPGCYNAFTHPHERKTLVRPEELAEWIISIEGIEGITFSGGEPFEQAEAIAQTIEIVNSERKDSISVFIFTGFEMDVLNSSSSTAVQRLLNLSDMLSAGPYVHSQRDTNLLWKGSTNQNLVYLTNRYSSTEEEMWFKESPVEELVMQNNDIKSTGFLGRNGHIYSSLVNI